MNACSEANDDKEVIARVLSGDLQSFRDIVERHQQHILGIVSRMVGPEGAPEVAHETFVRAYRDLRNFHHRAPLQHWLSRIASRAAVDYWRSKRGNARFVWVDDQQRQGLEAAAALDAHAHEISQKRLQELVEKGLSQLTPLDRFLIHCLYFDEYSVEEVSTLLGWGISRVKVRAFRARRVLKKYFSQSFKEEV